MHPRDIRSQIVHRIIDIKTGKPVGVYSRACHDEYDFETAEQARNANVHGIHKDKTKYKIARYKVTYTLISDDCDNVTNKEIK